MSTLADPKNAKPPLAITMGEPAGISAEIIAKAWQARKAENLPPFFAIDDPARFEGIIPIKNISNPAEALEIFEHSFPVLPIKLAAPVTLGMLNPANANAVTQSIEMAVKLCLNGQASGMVTAPIHKALLAQAGFTHPGHTEFLATLCDTPGQSLMMLASGAFRVVPLTVHIALADVPKSITQDKIIAATHKIHAALKQDFGIENPRIAIAGLNPHAGEDGKFGREEIEIIAPAIQSLKNDGVDVTGPHPADTLFHAEAREGYDAALCMYHDQALIPLKTLDFHGGVNITLGLPIVRTSPDHGTALGIAGQNIARPDSLIAAIKTAAQIAQKR